MGGPRKLKNRVAIILDRSGSMAAIRAQAVQMFNDQVKTIKKAGSKKMETKVSLFTFSNIVDDPTFFNQSSKELSFLKLENYVPGGGTALYDSMGVVIDRLTALPEMTDPNCSFLLIVVTDGEENSSQRFTGAQLADRIQLLQKTGKWTFTFCGANMDIEKMEKTLHIPKGNTFAYVASAGGMSTMSASNSAGLGSYFNARAAGCRATSSFHTPTQATPDPNAPATVTTTTTTTKTVGTP